MASKQKQKKEKEPDYTAKGREFVVAYRQPRWWRWTARVVITPTFRTRWQTRFRIKPVRFSGAQVEEVGVRKANWGNPGFVHFRVKFNAKQHAKFTDGAVAGVNRLKIVHSHWQNGAFGQILAAGQKRYRWKVVNVR